MGSGQSRGRPERDEPLVFENPDTQIPVHLSPQLLDALQQQQRKTAPEAAAPPAEPAATDNAENRPPEPRPEPKRALRRGLEEERSSAQTIREAEALLLQAQSARLPGRAHVAKAHVALDAVLGCYSANRDRPLDCSEQVGMLKEAVRQAEREFLAQS